MNKFGMSAGLMLLAVTAGCRSHVSLEELSGGRYSDIPGVRLDCVARSPELVLVNRLNRGVDDYGDSIYATQLLDGSMVCLRPTIQRWGQWYQVLIVSPSGDVVGGNVNLPNSHKPMALAYAHVGHEQYLVVCHRDPVVGVIEQTEPYYLSNADEPLALAFDLIDYDDVDEDESFESRITGYSIAESGFCINAKGQVLWPGSLDQGDLYTEIESLR